MMIEMRCDCLPSEHDERDIVVQMTNSAVPSHYDSGAEKDVINQGKDGSCVSQCLYEMQRYNAEKWHDAKSVIDRLYVYERRKRKLIQGMTPREGLDILRHDGLIQTYARVPSMTVARSALISCGPILIALPVHRIDGRFWEGDDRISGYHAVTVTAYNSDGFMVKNSWGYEWENRGYGFLPVEDWKRVIEAWVIVR